MDYNGIEVTWDGHASLRFIDHSFTVAVDPYSPVSPEFKADIVLLTHMDEGHYDPGKLEEVCGDRTVLVAPASMEDEDVPCKDTEFIEEGETVDIYNVEIEAVPMHNEHHDRGEGIGYRFVMGGNSFYVAGDTGFFEDSQDLENRVGMAFLPIDGKFTMDIEDAVKMAKRVKPSVVAPYHYGEPFFRDVNPRPLEAALADINIDCVLLD
ncbi:MAG: MBL fold metallo-hydrolase [Candidatus Nanohaloarchaea archaeon]